MRLGTSSPLAHATPEDWAKKQKELGLSAINFHLTCEDDAKLIDEYVKAARENDLMLAEVGVWRNTMDPDEASRKEAIRYAIEHGQPGDVIIIAGKGHETYQEIKGVKYDMDDRVLIREVLEEQK